MRIRRRSCNSSAFVRTLWGSLLVVALIDSAAVRADDGLLDVLKEKKVLTQQEYERLKHSELRPAQRADLIEVLRSKGVLTAEEAAKLEQPSPNAPAAPAVAALPEKPAAAPSAPQQIGYDEGFFIRTQDGNYSLRFNGRIAENFYYTEPGTSQTNSQTIDRARLSADATVYKYFRLRLENEFTGSNGLRDAFIAINPMQELNLVGGQFTVPFSYELILSKRYTDFVERAAVVNSTVNPRRDIGVIATGQLAGKLLQYHLGVMNGAGQNTRDNNADKDFVGHVTLTPFATQGPAHLRGLNVGAGATYGNQPGEALVSGKSTTSSITGLTEIGFNFYPAVTRRGERVRTGVHAAWLDGPFSITSEYIQTQEARTRLGQNDTDLPDFDTDGAYIDGTWLLTGETKPYNARIRPRRPLWDLRDPGWGAWEVALRYEYFKLHHGAGIGADGKADPALENRYDALVAGVNWFPNEFLRFSLNYLYATFGEQGKTFSVNPNKRSNNAVLGHAQFEF